MSTPDQHENGPLTRKQLREIRATGATPVISPEDAASAAATTSAARITVPEPPVVEPAVVERPNVETPTIPRQTVPDDADAAPLTRRQVRQRERDLDDQTVAESTEREVVHEDDGDADDLDESVVGDFAVPISASTSTDAHDDVSIVPLTPDIDETSSLEDADDDAVAAVAALGIEVLPETADEPDPDDVLADVGETVGENVADGQRPTVSSDFGQGVLQDPADPQKPFAPSFDDLLAAGDSGGSQHAAPNTLIFTPSAGEGSLSGPVASTGEVLITGSYELPAGLGSQGHALGTTDGREADAVLIDGELPPASSPTPIAASAAVSTIKPAGEVIRPPAPEKGNRLMLILAIVAGGLALAVGVAVIIAFTGNVL